MHVLHSSREDAVATWPNRHKTKARGHNGAVKKKHNPSYFTDPCPASGLISMESKHAPRSYKNENNAKVTPAP